MAKLVREHPRETTGMLHNYTCKKRKKRPPKVAGKKGKRVAHRHQGKRK